MATAATTFCSVNTALIIPYFLKRFSCCLRLVFFNGDRLKLPAIITSEPVTNQTISQRHRFALSHKLFKFEKAVELSFSVSLPIVGAFGILVAFGKLLLVTLIAPIAPTVIAVSRANHPKADRT
ncbi:hypothetical protein [Mannheimia haemolytica]|uniref:hypothetical protein n=1 Tax=Mannheimia haemolytica TaxID=75985 RepID=UPI0012BCF403|nr:hypothetical protein [Mannheimia haemolytica]